MFYIDNINEERSINGWTPLTIKVVDDYESVKSERDWETAKDEAALGISSSLYVIYNGVDKNFFRIIKTCINAKETCKTLVDDYKGTSRVWMLRL